MLLTVSAMTNIQDCKSASDSFTETSAAELQPLDEFSFAVDNEENYLCFNAHVRLEITNQKLSEVYFFSNILMVVYDRLFLQQKGTNSCYGKIF